MSRRMGIAWVAVALAAALVAGCGGAKSAGGAAADGRVAISVTEDGFVPNEVTVPFGKPVTLVVTRTTDKTCATELVMPAMDIKQALPLDEAVEVTFTPKARGTLDYACGMDMVKGKVIVK